jgi:hypothetical protein
MSNYIYRWDLTSLRERASPAGEKGVRPFKVKHSNLVSNQRTLPLEGAQRRTLKR